MRSHQASRPRGHPVEKDDEGGQGQPPSASGDVQGACLMAIGMNEDLDGRGRRSNHRRFGVDTWRSRTSRTGGRRSISLTEAHQVNGWGRSGTRLHRRAGVIGHDELAEGGGRFASVFPLHQHCASVVVYHDKAWEEVDVRGDPEGARPVIGYNEGTVLQFEEIQPGGDDRARDIGRTTNRLGNRPCVPRHGVVRRRGGTRWRGEGVGFSA